MRCRHTIPQRDSVVQKSIFSQEQGELLSLLKEARQEAGLTQADVSLLLDLPQTILSNIERGERRIDLLELRRLVWALGLTLPEFVERLEARMQALEGPPEAQRGLRAALLAEIGKIRGEGEAARLRLEAIRRSRPHAGLHGAGPEVPNVEPPTAE